MNDVIDIDEDERNADWLKTLAWDILPEEGESGADALLRVLGVAGDVAAKQKAAVARFMRLPAVEAMPDDVSADLKRRRLL